MADKTSANLDDSCASIPNAESPSVIISHTFAKSSPVELAAANIPAVPSKISLASQPASAIYCMASLTCVALQAVVAPISVALSFSDNNSSPVEPDNACTLDIALSKSIVVFILAVPSPIMGVVIPRVRELPILAILSPTF